MYSRCFHWFPGPLTPSVARLPHSKYSSIGSGGRFLLDLGYLGRCIVQSSMVESHAMVAGSCWILDIWDLELSLNLQRLGGV